MSGILYQSTRGGQSGVSASQAIWQGLALDGGLFVPDRIPELPAGLEDLAAMDYRSLALEILSLYLTDFTREELRACVDGAYDAKFTHPDIAPVRMVGDVAYLELFHGATIAFKDMALSILPYLMTTAAAKLGEKREIVILTATSGDTGKAAMAGFAGVEGTRILVFYPEGGVSAIQQRQMQTQAGANVGLWGIDGNFDQAQSGVKSIFSDEALRREAAEAGYCFSSANSINIGRLVPQIVYYIYAYGQLCKSGRLRFGEILDVAVPTGNFGNILAAYYAKRMGLPLGKLICASNENQVLFDFFTTGVYDKNRTFILSNSPSMDILISSNLERLLFEICGRDSSRLVEWMSALEREGRYTLTEEERERLGDFVSGWASQTQTLDTIGRIYREFDYVMDTHTAVAAKVLEEHRSGAAAMVVSTASPFKFAPSVLEALGLEPGRNTAEGLGDVDALARATGLTVPAALEQLRYAPLLHRGACSAALLRDKAREFLGL